MYMYICIYREIDMYACVNSTLGQKSYKKKKRDKDQVISPTARRALFCSRTTPQPRGTLVEPWWNPRGTLSQGRPGALGAYLG